MLPVLGLLPNNQVQSLMCAAPAEHELPLVTHLLKPAHDLTQTLSAANRKGAS
jgi:hypothetical protein